jgi:AcrR family transcriptional regulator
MYSAETRAALLESATALFAEHGYAGTSLESVATASQVTRGAVYHHFASKPALFEAVLDEQESRAIEQIMSAATASDPWEAAMLAIEAFLDKCCDPTYGRLVWQEGPTALGWRRWREFEEKYFLGLVERFVRTLVEIGYVDPAGVESTLRFTFWIMGGAGMTLAETSAEDRPRVRDEWASLIRRTLAGLRVA